jgi:hypothetical protein
VIAALAIGSVMVSFIGAGVLALLIGIIKGGSFEARAFIIRTALCWPVVLLVLSPLGAVGIWFVAFVNEAAG